MFNNCVNEFVCEQSCADRRCVRGCDHGADVAGRNHDCSCLLTVSLTDDVNSLKRDEKAHCRHLRRGSPQLGNLAASVQREFLSVIMRIDRAFYAVRWWMQAAPKYWGGGE